MIQEAHPLVMLVQGFLGQATAYFAIVGLLFLVVWKWGAERLRGIPGVTAFKSEANMILVRVPDSKRAFDGMKARGVLVKACSYVSGEVPDFAVVQGQPARVVGDTRTLDAAWLREHPEARAQYDAWAGRR